MFRHSSGSTGRASSSRSHHMRIRPFTRDGPWSDMRPGGSSPAVRVVSRHCRAGHAVRGSPGGTRRWRRGPACARSGAGQPPARPSAATTSPSSGQREGPPLPRGRMRASISVRAQGRISGRLGERLPERLLGERPAAEVVVDCGQPDEQRRAGRAGSQGGLDPPRCEPCLPRGSDSRRPGPSGREYCPGARLASAALPARPASPPPLGSP